MNIIKLYEKFPTEKDCLDYLIKIRWKGNIKCIYCGHSKVGIQKEKAPRKTRLQCYHNNCKKSFSVTQGTIYHRSHFALQKWFLAACIVINAKKSISSCQLARDLGTRQATAWRILHKIRGAMKTNDLLLRGDIEMDETFIGKRDATYEKREGRRNKKLPIVGMLERKGNLKALLARNITGAYFHLLIKQNIDIENSRLFTDSFQSYQGVKEFMVHKTVNHRYKYVDGEAHTNTLEGFWSLFKRGFVGQYHKLSAKYLDSYLTEFCWRYNNRKNKNIFNDFMNNSVALC